MTKKELPLQKTEKAKNIEQDTQTKERPRYYYHAHSNKKGKWMTTDGEFGEHLDRSPTSEKKEYADWVGHAQKEQLQAKASWQWWWAENQKRKNLQEEHKVVRGTIPTNREGNLETLWKENVKRSKMQEE